MIGTRRPAPQPADDLDAVDPREPEVEDHEVGVLPRGDRQRGFAGRGELDVVVARPQVRREGPQDLGSSSTTRMRVIRPPAGGATT